MILHTTNAHTGNNLYVNIEQIEHIVVGMDCGVNCGIVKMVGSDKKLYIDPTQAKKLVDKMQVFIYE